MFALVKQPAAWWPCKWSTAIEHGAVREEAIELKFKRLDEDELAAALYVDTSGMDRAAVRAHNVAAFEACVADWRGVVDADGAPIALSPATRDQLLLVPNFVPGFTASFLRFHRAVPEETAKNSGASPDGGPATGDAPTAGATGMAAI